MWWNIENSAIVYRTGSQSQRYRVGQSFCSDIEKKFILTISVIYPKINMAKCQQLMWMEDTIVCPIGRDNAFIQMKEDLTLDLTLLKVPCQKVVKKSSLMYDQKDQSHRSFCYYNNTGRVIYHHMLGRPTALDLFAGVGGMSIALEQARIVILLQPRLEPTKTKNTWRYTLRT